MGRILGAMALAPVAAILALLACDVTRPGEPGPRQVPAAQTAASGNAGVRIDGACRPGAFSEAPPDQAEHIPYVYPVRPTPDGQALPLDTARAGETGHACDRHQTEDAEPAGASGWWGVVYGDTDKACGLVAESRRPRNYAGPCRWGWVEEPHFTPDGEAPPPDEIAYEYCGDGDCGPVASLSN